MTIVRGQNICVLHYLSQHEDGLVAIRKTKIQKFERRRNSNYLNEQIMKEINQKKGKEKVGEEI